MGKHIATLALSSTLMLLSVVLAFTGTWIVGDDSTWTYLDENGENTTGWINDDGDRYYLSEDDTKKIERRRTKGNWYYFGEDGVLTMDKWVGNYYIDSEGKWIKTR